MLTQACEKLNAQGEFSEECFGEDIPSAAEKQLETSEVVTNGPTTPSRRIPPAKKRKYLNAAFEKYGNGGKD